MGREPDEQVRADQLADLRRGQVVLPDMNPVGVGLAGDERTVVDDQQRPQALAQGPRGVGDPHELVIGQLLLAQLHHVDAPRDRAAQQVRQPACVPSAWPGHGRADKIQARRRQPHAPRSPCVDRRHRLEVWQARDAAREPVRG